jgi:hypothetical protein
MNMIKCKFIYKVMPFIIGALLLGCHDKITIKLETFETKEGWGYQLKKDDKIFIRQEQIPAIAGNYAFASKSDAEKTGRLVLQKLKEKRHPAVSAREIDSLKISYTSFR